MAGEHATARERRRAERAGVSREIALVVDSGHSTISQSAFAVDLSRLGARIRTELRLEVGQSVTVIPREGSKQAVRSRVVWVNDPGQRGNGEAGIAFLEPTTLET